LGNKKKHPREMVGKKGGTRSFEKGKKKKIRNPGPQGKRTSPTETLRKREDLPCGARGQEKRGGFCGGGLVFCQTGLCGFHTDNLTKEGWGQPLRNIQGEPPTKPWRERPTKRKKVDTGGTHGGGGSRLNSG